MLFWVLSSSLTVEFIVCDVDVSLKLILFIDVSKTEEEWFVTVSHSFIRGPAKKAYRYSCWNWEEMWRSVSTNCFATMNWQEPVAVGCDRQTLAAKAVDSRRCSLVALYANGSYRP